MSAKTYVKTIYMVNGIFQSPLVTLEIRGSKSAQVVICQIIYSTYRAYMFCQMFSRIWLCITLFIRIFRVCSLGNRLSLVCSDVSVESHRSSSEIRVVFFAPAEDRIPLEQRRHVRSIDVTRAKRWNRLRLLPERLSISKRVILIYVFLFKKLYTDAIFIAVQYILYIVYMFLYFQLIKYIALQ